MLVIYEDTPEFLSLRTSRFQETLGLFVCGMGLLALSVTAIVLTDKSIELTIDLELVAQIAYYCIMFGFVGIILVFAQRKFLFYIPELKIICWEGPRQTGVIPFSDVASIAMLKGNENRGLLRIIRHGGPAVLLTRGDTRELYPIARRIAKVMSVEVTTSESRKSSETPR